MPPTKTNLTSRIELRTTPKQIRHLESLERATGLDRSQLVRYAIWKLPGAHELRDGDVLADLVVAVTGRLPGELR